MSRILVLSDLWMPFPGGAERYIFNVTNALVARGHDVHILTSYAKAKSDLPMTIKDIGVYERQEQGERIIHDFYLLEYQPDVILTHHFFAGAFAELLTAIKNEYGTPFIEIIHNRPRHPDAAFAIFNSQYTADRAGFREGDLVMLPPATEECVAPQNFFNNLRYKNQVYIGHVKPLGGKGIALTYQLARAMPERKFLILRGEWQDGEDIQRLPNVEFMEPVDDIREFYAKCRIVLMPSLSEDAGTIPQECALNGIPCISSNVGGLPETNAGGIVLPVEAVPIWEGMIEHLDASLFYSQVVAHQRKYVIFLNFPARFDEIDRKVRALCR